MKILIFEKLLTRGIIPCILFFVIGGCATFHSKPISPAHTAADFQMRNLNDPNLKKFLETNLKHEIIPWPPKSWDFPMLSLVAFYYHPDLDVARATWGVAKAGIVTAGVRPNPTLGVLPEFVFNAATGVSPWILGFNLDVPVETFGKRGSRISKAKNLSESARLKIAAVAWQVRSRLRDKLLDLYAASQTTTILQQEMTLQEEQFKRIQERDAAGEVSPLVVTEAQMTRDQTLLSLSEAQKKAAEARVQVADAVGVPVEALAQMNISFSYFDTLPPIDKLHLSDVRQEALLGRPDILGALADYAASESALRLELAKQYPDIHLGPGYTFDQGQNKWALGFSVSLPVFNRNGGPIGEAGALRTEAAAKFYAFQSHILAEINQAWEGYRMAFEKLKVADSLQSAKTRQQKFLENAAGIGEVRRVSLLNSRHELDLVKLTRLETLIHSQKSLGLLEDSLQQPMEVVRVERQDASPDFSERGFTPRERINLEKNPR